MFPGRGDYYGAKSGFLARISALIYAQVINIPVSERFKETVFNFFIFMDKLLVAITDYMRVCIIW